MPIGGHTHKTDRQTDKQGKPIETANVKKKNYTPSPFPFLSTQGIAPSPTKDVCNQSEWNIYELLIKD